jgi:hypothetical protein
MLKCDVEQKWIGRWAKMKFETTETDGSQRKV